MLKAPCKNCPFLKSGDAPVRLTRGRVREVWGTTTWNGGSFPCHKTIKSVDSEDDEEQFDMKKAQQCLGSTLSGIKSGEGPSQLARIMLRLSSLTHEEIEKMLPLVFGSEKEMLATALDRGRKGRG